MEITDLSNARSNTVNKLLSNPEFPGLLIEHGWSSFPERFLKAVANANDTPTEVLLDMLPSLSLDMKIKVAQQSKHPFIVPCMIWPELVMRWQPRQYSSGALAWQELVSEYPKWITGLSGKPMASVSDQRRADERVYTDYFMDPVGSIIDKLEENPGWPSFWPEIAVHHPDEAVRESMVYRLADPPHSLLLSLTEDPSHLVRSGIIARYHNNEPLMKLLMHDENLWVIRKLAEYSSSAFILDYLCHSMNLNILGSLAHNQNFISDHSLSVVWLELVKHPYVFTMDSFTVMSSLTSDGSVNWQVYSQWCEHFADVYPDLRIAMPPFRNYIPDDLKTGITTHYCDYANSLFWFNCTIAKSPLTPEPILRLFCLCPFEKLRMEVALNPALPDPLIKLLLNDPSPEVAAQTLEHQTVYVQQHPEVFSELIINAGPGERCAMAENEHCQPSLLEKLSHDKDERVRAAVAGNDKTPADVLVSLAQDHSTDVLSALVSNPNTPEIIREGLFEVDEFDVQYSLLNFYHFRQTELLNKFADHPCSEFREMLVRQPYAAASLLTIMSQDSSVKVRRRVAKHQNTPAAILTELLKDKDAKVVKFAAYQLKNMK